MHTQCIRAFILCIHNVHAPCMHIYAICPRLHCMHCLHMPCIRAFKSCIDTFYSCIRAYNDVQALSCRVSRIHFMSTRLHVMYMHILMYTRLQLIYMHLHRTNIACTLAFHASIRAPRTLQRFFKLLTRPPTPPSLNV